MDGNQLRQLREDLAFNSVPSATSVTLPSAKISQEDFAAIVGLKGRYRRQTIQRMESGRYPISEAFAIAVNAAVARYRDRQARIFYELAAISELPEKIRYLARQKIDQADIARRLNVSRQYVDEVLAKKPARKRQAVRS